PPAKGPIPPAFIFTTTGFPGWLYNTEGLSILSYLPFHAVPRSKNCTNWKFLKNALLIGLLNKVLNNGKRNSLLITAALFPLATFCLKPLMLTASDWNA